MNDPIEYAESQLEFLEGEMKYLEDELDKLRTERDRLREALSHYADKRNWRRNYDGAGHLNVFQADTNGPYIALEALHPTQQEDSNNA